MIPLATTTGTIKRGGPGYDPYSRDPDTDLETVKTGIRCVIGSPSAKQESGSAQSTEWRLNADPCPVRENDVWVDERTGREYRVSWVITRLGMGLDHVAAGLESLEGVA